jgi:Domain of unknown function (DUF4376)
MNIIEDNITYDTFTLTKILADGTKLEAHELISPTFNFVDNTTKLKVFSWKTKESAENRDDPVDVATLISQHNVYDMEIPHKYKEIMESHPIWNLTSVAPSDSYIWNFDTKTWVSTLKLEDVKASKWIEIKSARELAEHGGFDVAGIGRFDSDAYSQSKIIGAITAASVIGPTFSIDWTLSDNSVAVLDATKMINVGMTMLAHINTTHENGRNKRALIDAVTTAAEVEAITW